MKVVENTWEIRQEAVQAMQAKGLPQSDNRIEVKAGKLVAGHKHTVYTYTVTSLKTGKVVLFDSMEAKSI